jgi:hypothetical protein
LYHPEEDVYEVGDYASHLPLGANEPTNTFTPLFTAEEATQLNKLFNDMDNLDFCPCSFSLSLIFKNSHRHD